MDDLADLTPTAWWRAVAAARHVERMGADAGEAGRQVAVDELPGELVATFERLVADGAPAQSAAMYVAGWYPGAVAEHVGLGLAGATAGLVVEPSSLAWSVHPDGWVMDATAGGEVLVASDHAWAGRDDVTVVADVDVVIGACVDGLIAATRPIVEAIRGLTTVGRAGLWNEVGDGLGSVLAYQTVVSPTEERVAVLTRAVAHPSAPWRARPDLWFVDSARLGRIHATRKGGCCLAYTQPEEPHDLADADAEHLAYLERFPRIDGQPAYCSTCTFRDLDDVAARHVYWHEQRR